MGTGVYTGPDGVSENLDVYDDSHNVERWFGIKAVQTATDWADAVLSPFRAISGAGVYGADANDEALVIGSDDTPVQAGMRCFALRRLLVLATSVATVYKVRISWGTGTLAAAVAAGQYTEVMIISLSAAGRHVPLDILMPAQPSGTSIWIQVANATDNATFDFVVGLKEYNG
jgi:hypothetical protein